MVDLNRIKIMPRDEEVLRLLAQGSSTQEIAGQLNMSVWQGLTNREIARLIGTAEQVVKNHLRTTFDKLGSASGQDSPSTSPDGGQDWARSLGTDQTPKDPSEVVAS